jgi:8-oxo-dGTP diphosphatase
VRRKPRRAYALIQRKGRILLVKNRRGRWTLPGGRALVNEKLRATARREVREETGLKVDVGKRLSGEHVRHHRGPCARCVVYRASVRKGKAGPRREIVAIAWVKPEKVAKRLRSFRRKEIRRIAAGLN